LGFLKEENIIIGVNLNLTTIVEKVFGTSAKENPMVEYFIHKFEEVGLYDVAPLKLLHIRRNYRVGVDGVSKRLDMLLGAQRDTM
jgi:hypothetical protein